MVASCRRQTQRNFGHSERITGYVTVRNEDKVKVVDLSMQLIVRVIDVGDSPDTLQLTPDLKTLVVALRGKSGPSRLMGKSSLLGTEGYKIGESAISI